MSTALINEGNDFDGITLSLFESKNFINFINFLTILKNKKIKIIFDLNIRIKK